MFLIDLLTLSHLSGKDLSDIKVVDDCACSSLLIVQVGGLILPVIFNLAIGLAAKVVPLDNANKEIANKYF